MTAPPYIRRRSKYSETMDDFPTAPWVTRAFLTLVVKSKLTNRTIDEPACGRGHMLRTLQEFSGRVTGSDIKNYGSNMVLDYLSVPKPKVDFKITNPPFALAEPFFHKMYGEARLGVGIFAKTLWAENGPRYLRVFEPFPPTSITILSQRMPGAANKIIRKGSPYLSHAWFWWDKRILWEGTEFDWFPPDTQRRFEREEDYD